MTLSSTPSSSSSSSPISNIGSMGSDNNALALEATHHPETPADGESAIRNNNSNNNNIPTTATTTNTNTNTPTTIIDRPRFYDSEEEGRSLIFVESQSSLLQLSPQPSMHNRQHQSSSSSTSTIIHNETSNNNYSNINHDNNIQQQDSLSARSLILSSSISEEDNEEGNHSVVRVRVPSFGIMHAKNDNSRGGISSNNNITTNNDNPPQVLLPYQHRKMLNEQQQQQQQHLQQQQIPSVGARLGSNILSNDRASGSSSSNHDVKEFWSMDMMNSMVCDGNNSRLPPFPQTSLGAPSSPQQKQNTQQQTSSSLATKFMVAPIPPFKGSLSTVSDGKKNMKQLQQQQQQQQQRRPSFSDDSVDEDTNPTGQEGIVHGQGQGGRIRKVKSATASPSFVKKKKKREMEMPPNGSGLSPIATHHLNTTVYDNNRPPRAPPHPYYHPHQQQQQALSSSSQQIQRSNLYHHHYQDVINPNPPPPPPPPPSPPSTQHLSPRGNGSGGFHIRINSQGSISSLGSNAGVDDAVDRNFHPAGGGVTSTTAHREVRKQQRNKQQLIPQPNSREYWYYVQQQQQQQQQQAQQRYTYDPPDRSNPQQKQQVQEQPIQQHQQQHRALNYNVNYNAVLGQEVAQFLHGESIAKAAEWNQRQQQNRASRSPQPYDPYGPLPYGWNPNQSPHVHASQHQWNHHHQQQQHPYGWYGDHQDRRHHNAPNDGHFTPEPQAPHHKYSQQHPMQQHWIHYGTVPSTSPHKPYQLSQNERHDDIPSEKRSLLLPGIPNGGGGGEGWIGTPSHRNYEVPLQNAGVHCSENQKKKKKGERRRYQKEKRRQFYPSDSSEEDTLDNRREWSSSGSHRRSTKSKKSGRPSSRSQRRKRHSHHTGKATPSQNDESLSETYSDSFISNSLADRSRARGGVGVIYQLYISAKLLICNLPLSFAAISFSISLLGIVWLKWTQEIVPSCKEVNFHTSQCNFPEFPGCYFCDEFNPWYRAALHFHSACSWVAGTSVLLYFAKAICCWRVFIDEMSSPTTASPSGLIFMTMALSFVGKFGTFGALLVFLASTLHLILVVWFIYMSLAYQTMPDPSWFANTVGIGLCAVKVWFYSPLSGHFLIALTLMLTFVYYPISLIRVALNEKMSATICWMNMMGPAVSLYSLAIIMEPTFQQERPDISHFQKVQRSIYLPCMTCLFGLCIIGMISSIHGLIARWRQLSRETFTPAHAAYSFPLLMHAMAVQSYRSSMDFFSPPESGNPALQQMLQIYWVVAVVVGTIAALTCIIMYLVFLPTWVDVDTRDELEPPPPNETSICNSVTYGESLIQTYISPTILQANETGILIMVHDYQNDWWDLVRTRRIPAYGFEPRMRSRSFVRERNAFKLFMGWQDVILEGDEGGDDVHFDDEEKITDLP